MLNMATLGKVPSLGCGSYDLIAQVSVFASTNNICAWVSFPCPYNFIREAQREQAAEDLKNEKLSKHLTVKRERKREPEEKIRRN